MIKINEQLLIDVTCVHCSQRSLRRDVPQSTPPLFGTTSTLHDDHHTYGLVHWSGLPKEVWSIFEIIINSFIFVSFQRIFILTRKRKNNYSVESFLWMLVTSRTGLTYKFLVQMSHNNYIIINNTCFSTVEPL